MLLLLVAVLCSYSFPVESVVRNNSVVLARSFLRCLSSVKDGATLPKDINDQSPAEDILAGTLGCIQLPIARGLEMVASAHGGDLKLLGGSVVLKRTGGPGVTETSSRSGRSSDTTDLASTHDMFIQLDALSRSYEMEVNLYPGVKARLGRSAKDEDAVDLNFRLDGIFSNGDGRQLKDYDDEDDEDYGEDDVDVDEPRHKKKKKKFLKKLSKKMKKYLPLLAIPLAIQMMLLPLYMTTLKVMAIKSIILGKMTLLLLMLNVFRNIQQREEEDEQNAQIAAEYYGLSDGIEYGSWINRRKRRRRRSTSQPYFLARK